MLGDNIGALQNLAKLKGANSNLAVAREIAWRQAAFRWKPIPIHKPAALNGLSDLLSRLEATGAEKKQFPQALAKVPRTPAPVLE